MVKGTISLMNAYVRVTSIDAQTHLTKGDTIMNKYYPSERFTVSGALVIKNTDNTHTIIYKVKRANSDYEHCFTQNELSKNYWKLY